MELFETLSAMLHTAADLLSATLPWPERDRLDIPIAPLLLVPDLETEMIYVCIFL
jgi:hypothetical protein